MNVLTNTTMKPEDKAALTAGSTTAVLGGIAAALLAHPLSWAAVVYGTYKISKHAYQRAQSRATVAPPQDDTSWYV